MTITYDAEVDALYIRFKEAREGLRFCLGKEPTKAEVEIYKIGNTHSG